MPDLLFVYGTLRRQFENDWARALQQQATFLGEAQAPGSIFQVENYPAYRPEPAGTVHGELYQLPDAHPLFTVLDDYEAENFTRVPVVLQDGREAWIYRYELNPPASARIESGDFTKA